MYNPLFFNDIIKCLTRAQWIFAEGWDPVIRDVQLTGRSQWMFQVIDQCDRMPGINKQPCQMKRNRRARACDQDWGFGCHMCNVV